MRTVVGEEGTSIGDFVVALKADFFDNCYLQQNAFDDVDAATSSERQKYVFDRVMEVLDLKFNFDDKTTARRTLVEVSDLFRNWNYAAMDSEEFKKIEGEIDAFVARESAKRAEAVAAAE